MLNNRCTINKISNKKSHFLYRKMPVSQYFCLDSLCKLEHFSGTLFLSFVDCIQLLTFHGILREILCDNFPPTSVVWNHLLALNRFLSNLFQNKRVKKIRKNRNRRVVRGDEVLTWKNTYLVDICASDENITEILHRVIWSIKSNFNPSMFQPLFDNLNSFRFSRW